jgi:predicted CopG family antitoxin
VHSHADRGNEDWKYLGWLFVQLLLSVPRKSDFIPLTLNNTRVLCVLFKEVIIMQKKLTVTINEEVYEGLRTVIGPRKISRFIEELVRPHVLKKDMYAAYKDMAADQIRESEALEWAEGTIWPFLISEPSRSWPRCP